MNYLPIEVWGLIITYLHLNDVIEFSCVCKNFYRLSRNNSFYVRKLKESKKIFHNRSDIVSAYSNFCKEFYLALFKRLAPSIKVDSVIKAGKIIYFMLYCLFVFGTTCFYFVDLSMKGTCACFLRKYT